jgi:hypothetical protein
MISPVFLTNAEEVAEEEAIANSITAKTEGGSFSKSGGGDRTSDRNSGIAELYSASS